MKILFVLLFFYSLTSYSQSVKFNCIDEEIGMSFSYDSTLEDDFLKGTIEGVFGDLKFIESTVREDSVVFVEDNSTVNWQATLYVYSSSLEIKSLDPSNSFSWILPCTLIAE